MKLYSLLASSLSPSTAHQDSMSVAPKKAYIGLLCRCVVMSVAIALNVSSLAQARSTNALGDNELAQALPTPIPPTAASNPTAGEAQYLVIVTGSSDQLLAEVRQIEPTAFVNFIEGASVIQAGRFGAYQNAQNRTRELANLGIGAQIKPATPALPMAASPVGTATVMSENGGETPTGDLPPIPIAATPSSAVEFGQAPPFPTAATSATSIPATPPALAVTPGRASGYYVVVPSRAVNLAAVADQMVGLGAAPDLVQTRQAPRGPHVAIGPYDNRDIAGEWSNYLREAGFDARVYFE